MAVDSDRVINMARILAIVHIVVGFLLICFGIAERAVEYFWTGYGGFGIWIGIWAGIFMGFSITSAVFGGIIIICYSIAIAMYRYRYDAYWYDYNDNDYSGTASWRTESPTEDYWNRWTTNGPTWGWWGTTPRQYITRYGRDHRYNTEMALSAFILILGIVEFATGIWAAVCLCLMNPCTCCYNSSPPQQGQTMYTANSGYAMSQFPGGGPVAVPMQAGGGMVAVHTLPPGVQGAPPQMVVLPVTGGVGSQPQFVQVPTSGAMPTGYQPQQVVMPPTASHGGYARMQNEQDPVVT
ncbi:uncharacterized protein LOC144665322 isoform X2 [Oculina patagonica]